MRLTRGRRKPFSCGHKGFGKFCHRCDNAEKMQKAASVNTVKPEKAQAMKEEAKRLLAT